MKSPAKNVAAGRSMASKNKKSKAAKAKAKKAKDKEETSTSDKVEDKAKANGESFFIPSNETSFLPCDGKCCGIKINSAISDIPHEEA